MKFLSTILASILITETLASSSQKLTWKGLSPVVQADSKDVFGDRSNPTINLLGYTEFDAADLVMGTASGLFGRDVRTQWTGCILGVPQMFLGIFAVFKGINFADITSIFTNFSKLQKIFTGLIGAASNVPTEIMACKDIVQEIIGSIGWIVKHISITTVTTGLLANLTTHIMDIIADGTGIFTSFFGHDLYTFGLDIGSLVMVLLN